MRNRLALVLVALSLASVAACKGDAKKEGARGGKVASCHSPGLQSCREYRGGNLALGTEYLAKLCSPELSPTSKFSETACPTDKLIGTCAKDEGKDFFYEGYAIAAARNAEQCTSTGGTYAAK